jgi:ATP-dependent DNA helicase RecG
LRKSRRKNRYCKTFFSIILSPDYLHISIEYLKGVGPQKAEILRSELNLFVYSDLLSFYPSRYIDKSKITQIREVNGDTQNVQLRGKLTDIKVLGTKQAKRLSAILQDGTGAMELVWFKNYQYVLKVLKEGATYTVFGKPSEYVGKLSVSHPEIKLYETSDDKKGLALEPVYPLTEKLKSRFMDSRYILSLVQQVINHPQFDMPEYIPQSVTKPLKLVTRKAAIYHIHMPSSEKAREAATRRIKFDEMFILAMRSEKSRSNRLLEKKGIPMTKPGKLFNRFYHEHLKFELTEAQKRVIREIREDMRSGKQMNRLLQGDVGSGKTIVALFCMLMSVDNEYQACLMAPTEILATQHYLTIKDMLHDLPLHIELLTGSTTKKKRIDILNALKSGQINMLIGTHALIEGDVEFKSLGLSVIDEQHRFGVAQRARLWNKTEHKRPHVLVMTATPIPRTLAMTIHGELDVSVIDELPKDRKPVKTVHRVERFRAEVMEFVRTQIALGRQAYIVYPLIEESNKLELNDLMNGYDTVTDFFPLPKYQVSILHGRLKADVKEFEMQRFKNGITNIMVSTTVIEVGVNVPNASVMVIENANRFGLSQLHQLRGRVGRGADQSYCVLMTRDEMNYASKKRIKTMCKTNNGFEISEADLELRGPGDVLGTRQSGLPDFKMLDLVNDSEIIDLAKRAAAYILKHDPGLNSAENQSLLNYLKKHQDDHFWGHVS